MTMVRGVNAGLAVMLLLSMASALGAADPYPGGNYAGGSYSTSTTPANQIENCTVELIRESYVPAMVPGVIESIVVTEGATVAKDAPLAQLDSRESQMDLQLANDELDVATKQAENDIDEKVATAAYGVAYKEWESALEVNKKARGAISDVEVSRLHFEAVRARLAILQAKRDFDIATVTVHARETQVQAAQLAVDRRAIKAPIPGVVQQVIMHEGEWANPGDPLLRIVQLDQLKVRGSVDSLKLHPSEVANKTVTVDVELARGRHVQFTGRIDYVSAELTASDVRYIVSATVDNRKENGHWVLRPGMVASMTIDVGTLQAAERAPSGSTR